MDMDNTSIRRVESCCIPPKNSERNRTSEQSENAIEHPEHSPIEDAPLNLTLKKTKNTENKSSPESSLSNNSPPSESSHASFFYKDSDSLDMDCSQESGENPPHPVVSCVNRMNKINSPVIQNTEVNFPENENIIREYSPVSEPSIPNLGMVNGPTFRNAYPNGLSLFENQILTSSSSPMPMGASAIQPATILPLNIAQYRYGYVEHPNPFMQVYKHTAVGTMVDVTGIQKSKRKNDPFPDSLQSCSVEELQKKLDALTGGNSSQVKNSDYAFLLKPSYNPQECNGKQFSNNASPVVNNGASTSRAGNSNDSLPNNMQETSDCRRRKPTADYRDDANDKLKRAKKNMAQRRSRERRRIKEELLRKTVSALEQKNKVILRDLAALRFTLHEAQMKFFDLHKKYQNIKVQNYVMAERLSQQSCGQCGYSLPNVSSPGL